MVDELEFEVQVPDVLDPPFPLLLEPDEQVDVPAAKTWWDSTSCTATNASAAATKAMAPLTNTFFAIVTID